MPGIAPVSIGILGKDRKVCSPHVLEVAIRAQRLEAVSQFEFVQRLQSLPTNIFAACLSLLNCHRSWFDATFAHSPPPG